MPNTNRREFAQKTIALGTMALSTMAPATLSQVALGNEKSTPLLEVAAICFGTEPQVGDSTRGHTDSKVSEVVEPLKTTVTLLKNGDLSVCIVATSMYSGDIRVNHYLQDVVAKELGIPRERVMFMSSHNHSVPKMMKHSDFSFPYSNDNELRNKTPQEIQFYPFGEKLISQLKDAAKRLPQMLQPVTVWYAEGSEGRITYNRKGRRADGTTYFMREEDRQLVGKDFNGDIDRQAPVVLFKNQNGQVIAGLVQFTGHPVTSYHPEKLIICGDWPQTATDMLAQKLGEGSQPVPIGFLQGCAGDVNSKGMLCDGGVKRARKQGRMLGESYIKALKDLKPSTRSGMSYATEIVHVPLAPLPSEEELKSEIKEMKDFIRRAEAGDEDTLACVGLNFPRALSPKYRAALIKLSLPWNQWALKRHQTGQADTVAKSLDMPIYVLRLGDVGIIGMSCEPFLGIGRQIRQLSPLPLTIPCGYTNGSHGYITDSSNTGDHEYMSSFYRYTKFRPPLKKPAGDVLADRAAEILKQMDTHRK